MPRKVKINRSAEQVARAIERSYKLNKQRLEAALKELTPGCVAYVRCVEAMAKLDAGYLAQRIERGLDVSNVGLAARPNGWHFVCHVSQTGSVHCAQVDDDKIASVLTQRREETNARYRTVTSDPKRIAVVKELEQEFPPAARPKCSVKDDDDDDE